MYLNACLRFTNPLTDPHFSLYYNLKKYCLFIPSIVKMCKEYYYMEFIQHFIKHPIQFN